MKTVMKLIPVGAEFGGLSKDDLIMAAIDGREIQWLYLKSYNVDSDGGRGDVTLTHDVNEALKFASEHAAYSAWQQQSKTNPLRPDGKPNRPLTAYHATFETVDD